MKTFEEFCASHPQFHGVTSPQDGDLIATTMRRLMQACAAYVNYLANPPEEQE